MSTALLTKTERAKIRSSVSWTCPNCAEINEGALPDEEDCPLVYDLSDLLNDVTNWNEEGAWIEVGELEDKTRDYTCSYRAVKCGGCGTVPRADVDENYAGTRYLCPVCSEPHDSTHEAKKCCAHCCGVEDGRVCEIDRCLITEAVTATDVNDGWVYCSCDQDHDNECEVRICLLCHEENPDEGIWLHVKTHREEQRDEDTDTYDEEVDVGKPASLEPAFVYEDVSAKPVTPALNTACTICASEYCCELHGIHKTPHRGHAG